MDDLQLREVIESYNKETKTDLTNFHESKAICKTQNFYILLAFFFRQVTRGGREGGSPLPFFKNWIKVP